MGISSRTPEGDRRLCPICGKAVKLEPSSFPIRDAPCPHCGHLLRFEESSRGVLITLPLGLPPGQRVEVRVEEPHVGEG